MPLRYDPEALLVPGGAVAGLDNMGAAVVAALSRRADRRYNREAEDRQAARAEAAHARDVSEAADLYTKRRGDARIDETRGSVQTGATNYAPEMDAGFMFNDIDEAEAGGALNPDEARAARAARMAAKAQYQLSQGRIDAGRRPLPAARLPTQVKVPPAKTYRPNGVGTPQLDLDSRMQDLHASAIQADQAGFTQQASELRAQLDALAQLKAMVPPTRRQVPPTTLQEFAQSPEFGRLGLPAPTTPGYKREDIFNMTPEGTNVTFHERPDWIDDVDEDTFDANPQKIQAVQAALTQYNAGRKNSADDEFSQALAGYNARRAPLLAGVDPDSAYALTGRERPPAAAVTAAPAEDPAAADPETIAARVADIRARLQATGQDYSGVSDEDLIAAYGMTDE